MTHSLPASFLNPVSRLLLVGVLSVGSALWAQTAAASQPFEVDEGLWEVTLSQKYAMENQDLDPKTVAAMNEGFAKNVTVQHQTLCLTREFFRKDSLFGTEILGACAKSTSSSSQTLETVSYTHLDVYKRQLIPSASSI